MLYKKFSVTGVANVTTLDSGLTSLVDEKYRLDHILLMVSEYQNNTVEGWIGNERVLEAPDYLFDTDDQFGDTNTPVSTTKISKVPVNIDIPEGSIFKIGMLCGANATDLFGCYAYEKI